MVALFNFFLQKMWRVKFKRYKPEDLEKGLAAIRAGASLRKAAAKFNVPRSTLSDKVML